MPSPSASASTFRRLAPRIWCLMCIFLYIRCTDLVNVLYHPDLYIHIYIYVTIQKISYIYMFYIIFSWSAIPIHSNPIIPQVTHPTRVLGLFKTLLHRLVVPRLALYTVFKGQNMAEWLNIFPPLTYRSGLACHHCASTMSPLCPQKKPAHPCAMSSYYLIPLYWLQRSWRWYSYFWRIFLWWKEHKPSGNSTWVELFDSSKGRNRVHTLPNFGSAIFP